MILSMVHDLSPIIFTIYGDLAVRWYGLSYIMGFICAYVIIRWLAIRQKQGLTPVMVGDFITYGAMGVLIGGRLGYCLFYSPDLFLKFKGEFPYWGVLAVNEGGMASHGGMLGLVVACTLFSIKYGVSQLYLLDLVSLTGPVGIFFGRIANFINGELLGRPAPADYALAVKFPTEIMSWPAQSPEKLGDLSAVVEKVPGLSREVWLEAVDKFRMDPAARETVHSGLNEIIHAIQNGNAAAKEAIAPLLEGRYPSQLFGALGEGLLLFLFLFFMWRKPRKPGVIGCWFAILYACARIWDEQYRLPDAHLGYQLFDLTRGQWLSIAMLAIGLVFLFLWGRRETLPIPGWGRGQNVKIHRR
jgi:phosphatidylglycerol:prolipoprotein diacylglycerol transferase